MSGPELTWEQKLAAIEAFAGAVDLKMRKPGDWYVSCGMSIGGDGVLVGSYGNGLTPEGAVKQHWEIYSTLPRDKYAHSDRHGKSRRARWNGFMWDEITEEDAQRIMERSAKS